MPATNTPRRIEGKIKAVEVVTGGASLPEPTPAVLKEPTIHDVKLMDRPEMLRGKTYKIKPPTGGHAYYLTINDTLFFEDTNHETWAPYEVFINTKDTSALHWATALTRLTSAILRRGGDVRFLVEEFAAIHDPSGGYWANGVYMNSIIHEIGLKINRHMKALDLENKARQEAHAKGETPVEFKLKDEPATQPMGEYCRECHEFAVVMLDGCPTCRSCGAGKCS